MPANPGEHPKDTVALRPALKQDVRQHGPGKPQPHRQHPDPELLERLMRGELARAECRLVIRHLLAGCARCVEVTRACWSLGGRTAE